MRFTSLALRKLKKLLGATVTRRPCSARPQLDVLEDRLPVNWSPLAVNDSWNLLEDQQLGVQSPGVLANDSDEDEEPLTAVLVDGPAFGQLTFNADGSFTYVPQANYHGQVTFTYKAFDGAAWSNIATVTLTIQAVNDDPSAFDDTFSTDEDTPVTMDVLANDSDVDGDTLSISGFTNPSHGTLVHNGGGSFIYTPALNWHGEDSFSYTVG